MPHSRIVPGFRRVAIAAGLTLFLAPNASALLRKITIRFVGADRPARIQVVEIDNFGEASPPQTVTISSDQVTLPLASNVRRVRIEAQDFASADLSVEQLQYPISLEAFGHAAIKVRGSPPHPKALILADRIGGDAKPHTSQASPDSSGQVTAALKAGRWAILVDDSAGAPLLYSDLTLLPGERRSLAVQTVALSGSTEKLQIGDSTGKAIAGAKISWRSSAKTPDTSLISRWVDERQIRSDRTGLVVLDRLPLAPHVLRVEANSYRPMDVTPSSAAGPGGVVKVVMKPLPQLQVVLLRDGKPLREAAHVTVDRLLETADASTPITELGRGYHARLFEGDSETGKDIFVAVTATGKYRARATQNERTAFADVPADQSEKAPDLQRVTVDFVSRVISGHVTRGDAPAENIEVRALPFSSVVAAGSDLASARTAGDGSYSLNIGCRCEVLVQATTRAGNYRGETVNLAADETPEVNIRIPPGSATFRILDAKSRAPIPGMVNITLSPTANPARSESLARPANSDGEISIDGLEDGELTVLARHEGHSPKRLRGLRVSLDEQPAVTEIALDPSSAFRIVVQDQRGSLVAGAEILRQKYPHFSAPRAAPLESLGTTDANGELVLPSLSGEVVPIFAIAPGFTVAIDVLPAVSPSTDDPNASSLRFSLWPYVPGAGLRILNKVGVPRRDVLLLFSKNGIDIPLPVLVKAALTTGIRLDLLAQSDSTGEIHVQDLLAPGTYVVQALSPGGAEGNRFDPSKDIRDLVGTVSLPLSATRDLTWMEDRQLPPRPRS